jgi:hypothetical protein
MRQLTTIAQWFVKNFVPAKSGEETRVKSACATRLVCIHKLAVASGARAFTLLQHQPGKSADPFQSVGLAEA